jgi:hypothetical protein
MVEWLIIGAATLLAAAATAAELRETHGVHQRFQRREQEKREREAEQLAWEERGLALAQIEQRERELFCQIPLLEDQQELQDVVQEIEALQLERLRIRARPLLR